MSRTGHDLRLVLFVFLALGVATGVTIAATFIPYLGPVWAGILSRYLVISMFVLEAALIAALAHVMGLWRRNTPTRLFAAACCIVMPPLADIAFFVVASTVFHATMS